MKPETERIFERSPLPWTILRATQFHGFVPAVISALDRLPVVVAPKDLLQPIDVGEVANRTAELALAEPAWRAPDIGGPEVQTFADLARACFEAAGRRRRIVELPLPGKKARAFREGAQTAPDHRYGEIRLDKFLYKAIHHEGGRDHAGRSFRG